MLGKSLLVLLVILLVYISISTFESVKVLIDFGVMAVV
jgi:hypothetical protein